MGRSLPADQMRSGGATDEGDAAGFARQG